MNDSEKLQATVGRLISEVRWQQRMTQNELSLRCGVSQENLSRIERGKQNLSLEQLSRIADGLGVSVHILLEPKEPLL